VSDCTRPALNLRRFDAHPEAKFELEVFDGSAGGRVAGVKAAVLHGGDPTSLLPGEHQVLWGVRIRAGRRTCVCGESGHRQSFIRAIPHFLMPPVWMKMPASSKARDLQASG